MQKPALEKRVANPPMLLKYHSKKWIIFHIAADLVLAIQFENPFIKPCRTKQYDVN
jgi:hypothetical protein